MTCNAAPQVVNDPLDGGRKVTNRAREPRHLGIDDVLHEVVKSYLVDFWDGEESERSVADRINVSRKTVNNAKQDLIENGELGKLTQFTTQAEKRQAIRDANSTSIRTPSGSRARRASDPVARFRGLKRRGRPR